MSGPREQTTEPSELIAAVLVGHPLIQSHDERALDLCGGCVWAGRGRVEHAEHVAEVVAEALRLTEEHGYTLSFEGCDKHPDEPDAWFPADEYNTSRRVTHRRWVSGWSVVGGEQP